ncbi:MAG TPA: GWxTD domain-containing protein, partial [Candidatus Sulfopaludibacter sp.]|nr:GWxTD domain-containing protein [Candidatus Sulfopaludibacter sp.]
MNEALGWTLFHFLWEGAAIALALGLVLLACRGARVRYAAACIAMLAMLAGFGVTLAVKLPARTAAAPRVHVLAGPLVQPEAGEPGGRPAAAWAPDRWAVPLWLAGVVVLSLRRLMGLAGAYRLRHTGVRTASAPWPERMEALAARLGLRRRVALLESCLTEVPVAAGWLKPAILLPIGLAAGLAAEQVEFILLHELAHIARRDYLVNLMQSMAEAMLFYHPAVWWVSGVIRAEREHCCDDVVVALAGDAKGYAAALVTLEQRRVPELALAATGGSLTERVRRLLRQPAGPQSVAAPLAAVAVALAVAGLALAASQTREVPPPAAVAAHPAAPALVAQAPVAQEAVAQAPVAQAPAEPKREVQVRQELDKPFRGWLERGAANLVAQAQQQSGGAPGVLRKQGSAWDGVPEPYRKWVTQDVAYIITDQERAAFKALTTNEEREKFIEQFWLVRDPTPGTPENEFKTEHYRRIAYANDRFAAGVPGWKTDRGRIYITYGPPDEIEDHGKGGTGTFPYQQWRYRFIEGVGKDVIIEFVDPTYTGEYHMTMDATEKDALRYVTPGVAFGANEAGGRTTVRVNGRSVGVTVPFASPGRYRV